MPESLPKTEIICICHSVKMNDAVIIDVKRGDQWVMSAHFHKRCPEHQPVGASTYRRMRIKQMHRSWCNPGEFGALLNTLLAAGVTRADVKILEKRLQAKPFPLVHVEWPEYEVDPDSPSTETPYE